MRIGQEISIYQKWQTNEKQLGTAILIDKVRNGLPFILEDTYSDPLLDNTKLKIPESLTPVYNYQRWLIQFKTITPLGEGSIRVGDIREYNIRYLEAIGLSRSSVPEDEYIQDRVPQDNFLTIDGVEIF